MSGPEPRRFSISVFRQAKLSLDRSCSKSRLSRPEARSGASQGARRVATSTISNVRVPWYCGETGSSHAYTAGRSPRPHSAVARGLVHCSRPPVGGEKRLVAMCTVGSGMAALQLGGDVAAVPPPVTDESLLDSGMGPENAARHLARRPVGQR